MQQHATFNTGSSVRIKFASGLFDVFQVLPSDTEPNAYVLASFSGKVHKLTSRHGAYIFDNMTEVEVEQIPTEAAPSNELHFGWRGCRVSLFDLEIGMDGYFPLLKIVYAPSIGAHLQQMKAERITVEALPIHRGAKMVRVKASDDWQNEHFFELAILDRTNRFTKIVRFGNNEALPTAYIVRT